MSGGAAAVFLRSSDVYHTHGSACRYVLRLLRLEIPHHGGTIEEAETLWRREDQDPRRECEACRAVFVLDP